MQRKVDRMYCFATQILTSGFCLLCCQRDRRDENKELVPSGEEEDHKPMMMPGTILHVEKYKPVGREDGVPFTVTERNQSYFEDIVISPNMVSDHFPWHLTGALDAIVDEGLK